MAASRASTRALKHLAAGSKVQTRPLHMTGPATFSSLLTSERPAVNLPQDAAASQESKRPSSENAATSTIRQFNTSRSLKAVNDSSTIDFAFLPDYDPDTNASPVIRVPILPETVMTRPAQDFTAIEPEETVMRPQIMTVSADGTHIHAPSAMSEVSDNNAIDFQGMAAQVAEKLGKTTKETTGMVGELWSSFVDDVVGPKGKGPAGA